MDEVFAIDNPEKPHIVHFEPQAYFDPAFPARMLRYRADIWEASMSEGRGTQHIYQAAIFIFPEHENSINSLQDDGINYSYNVIRIWQTDKAKVIAKSLVGLYPLLPLMQAETDETPEMIMQQAVDKITSLSEDSLRNNLMVVLGIIGGEKYTVDFVNKFIRREMLMQSPVYQEWIKEDIKEAEIKLLRNTIIEMLEDRFEAIRKPLRNKILAISEFAELKALHKKSYKVDSLEDFEKFLDEKL